MSENIEDKDLYYSLPDEEADASSASSATPNPDVSPDSYVLPDDQAENIPRARLSDMTDEKDMETDMDEEEDEEEDYEDNSGQNRNPVIMMLRTLLTPIEGWKAIRRSKITPESFAAGCFYPLIAFASVSEFCGLIYGEDISVSTLLVKALLVFLAFFLGYFGTLVVGRLLIPEGNRILDEKFGKVFVMNVISTLAVFFILLMALPMLEPILVFLPLWTIYVICRGTRFLRFREGKEASSTCILCFLVIGMPLFMGWIFSEIIPTVS